MSNFVIIPDTSCDLNKELRNRFGIPEYLRGVIYYPDGQEKYSDLDWSEISPEQYYTSMKGRKILYKTATPKLGDIKEVFEKYLSQGKDVLSVSLSSALSTSFEMCQTVAEELKERYPERRIVCVDSLRYSTALSLIVIKAAEKQAEGLDIDSVSDYINEYKHTVHQMGPMDDLFFLTKTGRISNFKAFFGTLVGVNPMADFNEKGMSEVVAKFKGKKSAFDATLKYMEKTIEKPEEQIIFVAHSNREKAARLLAEQIKEKFSPKEIIINPVGMACGASIGPGLCAAFYHGKKISQGLNEEKAIMNEIVGSSKDKQ